MSARCLVTNCFIALATTLFATPYLRAGDNKTELEGVWVVTAVLDENGKRVPADQVGRTKLRELPFTRLVVRQDRVTITHGEGADRATLKLDPAPTPRTIDLVPTSSDDRDKPLRGIYQLDRDTLCLSLSRPGRERPTEFKFGPGLALELKRIER